LYINFVSKTRRARQRTRAHTTRGAKERRGADDDDGMRPTYVRPWRTIRNGRMFRERAATACVRACVCVCMRARCVRRGGRHGGLRVAAAGGRWPNFSHPPTTTGPSLYHRMAVPARDATLFTVCALLFYIALSFFLFFSLARARSARFLQAAASLTTTTIIIIIAVRCCARVCSHFHENTTSVRARTASGI